MPYGNINVDTVTTSTAGGVLGAGNASLMKNRIINGAMVINQRAFSGNMTTAGISLYTLDRWQGFFSLNDKYSVSQNAGSVTPPNGFKNYLGATSLAATTLGAGDYFYLSQKIEGYNVADLGFGTASAKTITVSFWVYSSLTGTFGGSLTNAAENRFYPFTYTISSANTWEQKTVTVAGDTSGTWGTTTGTGLQVILGLGVGTTYSATAGAWGANGYSATGATNVVGTSGATFYFTGVQLEVGSSATGYEYVNYQTSLANCQRYYVKITSNGNRDFSGYIYSSALTISMLQFPVPMRTAPSTLTTTGTASDYQIYYTNTSTGCSSIPSINATGIYSACLTAVPNASLTAGQGMALGGANTSAYFGFSAEL